MIRSALMLGFFLLYFYGNILICDYFYPFAWQPIDVNNPDLGITQIGLEQADKWTYLRLLIFDFMFLMLTPLGFLKSNKLSKALLIPILLIIVCNIIDKLTGNDFFHRHDIWLAVGCIIITLTIYRNERRKEKLNS